MYSKTRLIISLILMLLGAALAAQTQVVKGTIIDSQSESPLFGANVILVGTNQRIGAYQYHIGTKQGRFRL